MDHEEELTDSQGVTKARSAYTYFMIANGGNVKDSDGTQGGVLASLAAKVLSLLTLVSSYVNFVSGNPCQQKKRRSTMNWRERIDFDMKKKVE